MVELVSSIMFPLKHHSICHSICDLIGREFGLIHDLVVAPGAMVVDHKGVEGAEGGL